MGTMTYTKLIVFGMLIPGVLGLAAMAAIVVPGGDELTWPRLAAGCAALVATQIIGGYLGGRVSARCTAGR
jgi:hypothetical protein